MKNKFLVLSLVGALALGVLCSCKSNKDKNLIPVEKKAGYKSDFMKKLQSDKPSEIPPVTITDQEVRIDKASAEELRRSAVTGMLDKPSQIVKEETYERKPFYLDLMKGVKDEMVPADFNFDAMSIMDVVDIFSGSLNFKYIYDPRVKGAVTMMVPDGTKMSKKEIWQLFDRILWLNGAYCTVNNGIVNILPLNMMSKENGLLIDGDKANVEVRLFHLFNVPSNDVLTQIREFLTTGAPNPINIQKENAILVVETPGNMPKISSLIRLLDKKDRVNWPKLAIRCVNIPASQIVEEMAAILPVLGFPVTIDKVAAEPGSIHLTSIDRLGLIIASAANQEGLDEIKVWINKLDQDDIGEHERVYVYKVVNSNAEELEKAVSTIFNATSSSSSPKVSASTSSSSAAKSSKSSTSTRSRSSRSSKSSESRVHSVFENQPVIFSDGVHNRLLIRTEPRTYAMLNALLRRLDTVPAQVLLQLVIAEVTLNEDNKFGMEFNQKVYHPKGYRSLYGTDWSKLTSYINPETGKKVNDVQGLNYLLFDKNDPNKFAYIRAMAGTNNTKVLSSPQILAVSHKKAMVKVGDQVPIVTNENSNTESGTNIQRQIQYKDTGIILNITPHITKGGLVGLEIDQQVSDAIRTTSSDIDSPTIQERQITTQLSIRDGATLVVGGLIWDRKLDNRDNVPIINKIPIFSNFIGYNEISHRRTELLMLITATVITEKTDLQEKIKRYKNAVRLIDRIEK